MLDKIAVIAVLPLVSAADTCMSNPQLLGVIFGSVAAALLLCAAVAGALWFCTARTNPKKGEPKAAYTNTACDVAENGCTAKPNVRDQMTKIDSFKARNGALDVGTQKSFSTQNINEVDGKVGVQLNGEDLGGLGFNIQGNMTDGIFVKTVHPKGPAEQCGNILQGDRIKSLTISFENMVYEDAVTLLSYASPYKVKLELERKLEDAPTESEEAGSPRVHPLFRSNTLTNIHFSPVGCSPLRSASETTTQVHGLPERPKSMVTVEEKAEPVEEKPLVPEHKKVSDSEPDSTTGAEADISKQDSSDDLSSTYRESLDDAGTGTESVASSEEISQSTLPDRIEISEIITDEIHETIGPVSPKAEYCSALPPKPRKIVSRSPSPKMISKPPTPPPSRASPVKKAESPVLVSSIPSTPETSAIPIRREQSRSRITPPSPPRAPEITETRVSRIPKRSDSVKTPVLERKLPSIPRRSPSLEKRNDDDVWSRLYQEKKGALKKTREPMSSDATSPRISRTPSGDRFNTLGREKRDRLAANQETLDRQTEELRRLGVL